MWLSSRAVPGDVQHGQCRLGVQQLPQAQLHAGRMQAAISQRLAHGLLDQAGRVERMQLENLHKLTHASTTRFLRLQLGQQPLVGGRPGLAPTSDRLGVLKSAGTLLQQRQVVQWIEDILLVAITARHGWR